MLVVESGIPLVSIELEGFPVLFKNPVSFHVTHLRVFFAPFSGGILLFSSHGYKKGAFFSIQRILGFQNYVTKKNKVLSLKPAEKWDAFSLHV